MSTAHHVATLAFHDRARSRAAFEEALTLPGLRYAAVLDRGADGVLDVTAEHTPDPGPVTAGAAILGGGVGLLGGPVGSFLGASAGALLANAYIEQEASAGYAGLIMLSADVEDDTALVVLDIKEEATETLDGLAARHHVTCHREDIDAFTARLRTAWKKSGT
ncbi:hypothetical protein [Streptomyces sp. NPDC097619]|uniref:hypothetical protein n=1 Tax=Streptomyces sp. NPDC097619 TaxID=3157228 RepID=UPI0033292B8C